MYCRALACDFDGTAATNGELLPKSTAVRGAAQAQGFVTMRVTGRVWEELTSMRQKKLHRRDAKAQRKPLTRTKCTKPKHHC